MLMLLEAVLRHSSALSLMLAWQHTHNEEFNKLTFSRGNAYHVHYHILV